MTGPWLSLSEWRKSRGETEVQSPISRRGSAAGSDQPLSPGARSNPSRRGDVCRDQMAEPAPRATRHSEPEPAQTKVVGPED